MLQIDISKIFEFEKKMVQEGVSLSARHILFAQEYFKRLGKPLHLFSLGDPFFQELMNTYKKYYGIEVGWKGNGIGIIVSLDRVRKVTLPVVYGNVGKIDLFKLLGFNSHEEFIIFSKGDREISDSILESLKHIYIFTSLFKAVVNKDDPESKRWHEAKQNLEIVAYALSQDFENKTIYQNLHLVAELSVKALLINRSVEESLIRNPKTGGHNLIKLIDLIPNISKKSKEKLKELVKKLPNYVDSRYEGLDISAKELLELALQVQEFASECVILCSHYDEIKNSIPNFL